MAIHWKTVFISVVISAIFSFFIMTNVNLDEIKKININENIESFDIENIPPVLIESISEKIDSIINLSEEKTKKDLENDIQIHLLNLINMEREKKNLNSLELDNVSRKPKVFINTRYDAMKTQAKSLCNEEIFGGSVDPKMEISDCKFIDNNKTLIENYEDLLLNHNFNELILKQGEQICIGLFWDQAKCALAILIYG